MNRYRLTYRQFVMHFRGSVFVLIFLLRCESRAFIGFHDHGKRLNLWVVPRATA